MQYELYHLSLQVDEYSDITHHENLFFKLWNTHMFNYPLFCDIWMIKSCEMFIQQNGYEIISQNLRYNLLLHLIQLYSFSLLSYADVVSCMTLVDLICVKCDDDVQLTPQQTQTNSATMTMNTTSQTVSQTTQLTQQVEQQTQQTTQITQITQRNDNITKLSDVLVRHPDSIKTTTGSSYIYNNTNTNSAVVRSPKSLPPNKTSQAHISPITTNSVTNNNTNLSIRNIISNNTINTSINDINTPNTSHQQLRLSQQEQVQQQSEQPLCSI